MAYGSMRQMRSYADKVFDRDARLAHMTDERVDPSNSASGGVRFRHTLEVPSAVGGCGNTGIQPAGIRIPMVEF